MINRLVVDDQSLVIAHSKKGARGGTGLLGKLPQRDPACMRDGCGRVLYKRRFTTLSSEGYRCQEGSVGFDHEFFQQQLGCRPLNFRSILEGDQPGKRDKVSQIQHLFGLHKIAAKTVEYGADFVLSKDRQRVFPSVPMVDDDRLTEFRGQ